MKIFIVTFSLFVFANVAKAETLQDVIEEMQPIIKEKAQYIRNVSESMSDTIDDTHNAIDNIVRSGTTGLYNQIAAIQEDVNAALATGKNIRHCIDEEEEAAKEIDIMKVQICRDSNAWNSIGDKLAAISVLEVIVSGSVSSCISAVGVDPAPVRQCIQDTIDTSTKSADTKVTAIKSEVNTTKNTAFNCVFDGTLALNKIIDSIRKNFKDCVDAVPDN